MAVIIPPAGWVLCNPENPYCGKPFFNGKKGGEQDSDEFECPNKPACKGGCECLLCYSVKFKDTDPAKPQPTGLVLPEPSLPRLTISRGMANGYKDEAYAAAKTLGLQIEVFDWVCVCLKAAGITGQPQEKKLPKGTIKIG